MHENNWFLLIFETIIYIWDICITVTEIYNYLSPTFVVFVLVTARTASVVLLMQVWTILICYMGELWNLCISVPWIPHTILYLHMKTASNFHGTALKVSQSCLLWFWSALFKNFTVLRNAPVFSFFFLLQSQFF